MRALLLVAHGSRRTQSNREILLLVQEIESLPTNAFDMVAHAFLQRATPSTEERMAELARAGVREVTVFPYFLASGSHVTKDMPAMVDKLSRQHPDMAIRLAPHLGALPGVAALIVQQIQKGDCRR